MLLPSIETPSDLRGLTDDQLAELAEEIRTFIVDAVTKTGGHLGSNLGVVELTIALHRVFDSPRDVLLFDTGHQAYVHKLLTGRRYGFKELKQRGGLSGYPSRAESEHDWIESSHASTALSYAHGLSTAFQLRGELQGHGGYAPRRRGRGRRLAHRRHGLRGAQQPRPLRASLRHHPQRQRPQLRADGVEAQRVAHEPAAAPDLHPDA